jgi:hypothetical protein
MDNNKIVVANWKYSDLEPISPELFKEELELNNAINRYYDTELKPKNIELYVSNKNIIVTENGCYGAFYEKDLTK